MSPTKLPPSKNDISPHFRGSQPHEVQIIKRLLKLEGTPEAIREFARQRQKLGHYVYWFTLGTLWVSYTGHSELELWKKLFSAERPHRAVCLMKPDELQALEEMPAEFVIYRAHRPDEEDWIAYTISPQVAGRFARERGVQSISAYTVRREDVLALFLRRGEYEVLVLDRSKATFLHTIDVIVAAEVAE